VAAELARLRAENARLLKMLDLSPRQAAPPGPAQAGFFEAPPGPVNNKLPQLGAAACSRVLATGLPMTGREDLLTGGGKHDE
jgi:hypothetical protein